MIGNVIYGVWLAIAVVVYVFIARAAFILDRNIRYSSFGPTLKFCLPILLTLAVLLAVFQIVPIFSVVGIAIFLQALMAIGIENEIDPLEVWLLAFGALPVVGLTIIFVVLCKLIWSRKKHV
ncbi:MAG: hypothetical protein AAFW81_09980 [Pseudomonadota bacterium]